MDSTAAQSVPRSMRKYPPSPHCGPHEFFSFQYLGPPPSARPYPTSSTAWFVFSHREMGVTSYSDCSGAKGGGGRWGWG